MTNETIRVSATYTLVIDSPFVTSEETVLFDIDKKEGLRTGYITPDYRSPDPILYAFGELMPWKHHVGVYRKSIHKFFHHVIFEMEAAEIISREMARYDMVLAASKLENEIAPRGGGSDFLENPIEDTEQAKKRIELNSTYGKNSNDMYQCPRCKSRGKTWSGNDPRCAFDADGKFLADNWNCATMGALRSFPRTESYCQDHSLGVIPLPEFEEEPEGSCPNFLVLHWYKSRGATPLAQVVYMNHTIKPLTLELAELILKGLEK